MIMVLPTMFRATQNRNEPNLSFAQSLSPTMFRDNQNPNEPNLPFSQSRSKRPTPTTPIPTIPTIPTTPTTPTTTGNGNNADIWKHIDKLYSIHGEQEGRLTDAYKHRLQIEKTAKTAAQNQGVDYGADIKKLYDIHGEQERRITDAYEHRTSIERKVETNIGAFPEIHTKLSDLGTAVSDVSSGLESHKLGHGGNDNGNGCDTWDIMCHIDNLKAQIGGAALLGGVAIVGYILLKKRMKL